MEAGCRGRGGACSMLKAMRCAVDGARRHYTSPRKLDHPTAGRKERNNPEYTTETSSMLERLGATLVLFTLSAGENEVLPHNEEHARSRLGKGKRTVQHIGSVHRSRLPASAAMADGSSTLEIGATSQATQAHILAVQLDWLSHVALTRSGSCWPNLFTASL